MNVPKSLATRITLVLGGMLTFSGFYGCQSNIGGQTLPSAYYLRDDVQFFPAGPEFLLPETRRAHEEYRTQQLRAADDDAGFAPGP
jgi:hypothetical protein